MLKSGDTVFYYGENQKYRGRKCAVIKKLAQLVVVQPEESEFKIFAKEEELQPTVQIFNFRGGA